MPSLFAVAAFALSGLGGVPLLAHADATTDALKATLQKKFGGQAPVSAVRKSPVAGLYEVTFGKQVVYSDPTGRYVILGNIRDTATGEDLTQTRTDELNRIDFARLPLNDAVKVVHGKGERKIAVFSDPNCPYCHRLEETLQGVDNVTVYTFLYPILSPDSAEKSKAIWCAKDKGKSWEDWMLRRVAPTASTAGGCDVAALERNLKLGQDMNVTGTPTVFLVDGNRLPGAVSADELKSRLASAH
ncbi:DsbC family protein [Robbsia betulipollinis]|uniref:DsbC family protein n=1 Tax=Robbsia betulipollinis TaxID=2981849 RepID=UPI003D7B507E